MTIDERVAALEVLCGMPQGNINTPGNITMRDDGRESSNPVKLFLGKVTQGLYFFWQKRFAGQSLQEYWAGFETWLQPPAGRPVAEGYGALPLRYWGQGVLMEANGTMVVRSLVAERLYLQLPAYRNRQTGEFHKPATFSAAGEPLTASGEVMGGIYWDAADLGTYVDQLGVVKNGVRVMEW